MVIIMWYVRRQPMTIQGRLARMKTKVESLILQYKKPLKAMRPKIRKKRTA